MYLRFMQKPKRAQVVYGSRRHDALTVLKVLRKPSTCADMRHVFPRIGNDDQLQHALRDLITKSLVLKTSDNEYQITNYGVNALRSVAKDTKSTPHIN